MITEQLLRDCVKEAQGKGQIGLFIWSSWKIWDEHGYEMKEKNELYDLSLSQMKKGMTTTIDLVVGGFSGIAFFAIPLDMLNSSEEFFKQVLEACEIRQMQGPITLIPSNEVSDHC